MEPEVYNIDSLSIVEQEGKYAIGFMPVEGKFHFLVAVENFEDLGRLVVNLVRLYGKLKNAHREEARRAIEEIEKLVKGEGNG